MPKAVYNYISLHAKRREVSRRYRDSWLMKRKIPLSSFDRKLPEIFIMFAPMFFILIEKRIYIRQLLILLIASGLKGEMLLTEPLTPVLLAAPFWSAHLASDGSSWIFQTQGACSWYIILLIILVYVITVPQLVSAFEQKGLPEGLFKLEMGAHDLSSTREA